MTDSAVLNAVSRAKRAYKTALTKARRAFVAAKERAMKIDTSYDVDRAHRDCELRRAELAQETADIAARIRLIDRLEEIRWCAGEWADLVPTVAPLHGDKR
jgi:hypothetical protein